MYRHLLLEVHLYPRFLTSRRRLCLHRIRASRHHCHFLFIHLRLLCLFAGHYCLRHLGSPFTYAQVRCCESCDSVLVHRACCPSVSESQPHLTLYTKLYYIHQLSTKTQTRFLGDHIRVLPHVLPILIRLVRRAGFIANTRAATSKQQSNSML